MIRHVFELPPYLDLKMMIEAQALEIWEKDVEGNKKLINQWWLKKEKNSIKKVPPNPKRSNFSKDIGDIITLLAKPFGK